MTSSNNLLVLNLGVDTDDTSLGFTQTWIEELNKKYTNIDVITMRLGKNGLDNKIGVHFINTNENKLSKIKQLVKIHKTFKSVLKIQDYEFLSYSCLHRYIQYLLKFYLFLHSK